MSKRIDEKLEYIQQAVSDLETNPLGMVSSPGFPDYTKKFNRLIATALTGTDFKDGKDGEEKLSGNKKLPKGSEIVIILNAVDRFLMAKERGMAGMVEQARRDVIEGKMTKTDFENTYGAVVDDDAPKNIRVSMAPTKKKEKRKVKGKDFRKKIVEVMNDPTATKDDFEEIFAMAEAYRKRRKFWAWMIGGAIVLTVVAGTTTVILLNKKDEDDSESDIDLDDGFDFDGGNAPPAAVTIDDTAEPLALSFG